MSNKKLAAIHVIAKNLGISEDERRDLYQQKIGQRSLSGATVDQIQTIWLHFRNLQGKTEGKAAYPGRPKNMESHANAPQLGKIEALLADMKLPWSYADHICYQVTGGDKNNGVKKLAWVKDGRQLRAIITALNVEQEKRFLIDDLTKQLAKNGLTMDDAVRRCPKLSAGRDRKVLRAAISFYAHMYSQKTVRFV